MRQLVLLLVATSVACSGPTHEISARGFSTTIKNHALARTTAENRAIAELQELLGPEGVSFTLKRVGAASLLEIAKTETKAIYQRVELKPLENGWMAIAFAERKPEVSEAMAKLTSVEASATVAAPVLEMAARMAKNRALRQLIDPTATGDGVFAGTITLVDLEYGFEAEESGTDEPPADDADPGVPADSPTDEEPVPEAATDGTEPGGTEVGETTEATAKTAGDETAAPLQKVTVTVRGVARAERTGDISDEVGLTVRRQAAVEHFRAGEWKESGEITTGLLELTPESLPFILLKAATQFHQDEIASATETLSLAIMEGGGPEAEALTNAFAELSKTVGADSITRLTAALEEQRAAAASAAEKSKKKKRKKKRKK